MATNNNDWRNATCGECNDYNLVNPGLKNYCWIWEKDYATDEHACDAYIPREEAKQDE